MEDLDPAVLVTTEDVSKDPRTDPVRTACQPSAVAVVLLVAANTDTATAGPATATPLTNTDEDTDTAAAEACTTKAMEVEASVCTRQLADPGNMVLVATAEEWPALAVLPMARPRPMRTVSLHLAAVRRGPCTGLLVVPSAEPVTTTCTWRRRARKRACQRFWVRTDALGTAVLLSTEEEEEEGEERVGLVVVTRDRCTDRYTGRSVDCSTKVLLAHRPA